MPPEHFSKPDLDLAIYREDLADAIATYRRDVNRPREWIVAIGGVALAVGIWMAGLSSNSTFVLLSTFVGGWAVLLGLNMRSHRRYASEISRLGLTCPRCREPLVEMIERRGRPRRADAILATGRCTTCGSECFLPEVRFNDPR